MSTPDPYPIDRGMVVGYLISSIILVALCWYMSPEKGACLYRRGYCVNTWKDKCEECPVHITEFLYERDYGCRYMGPRTTCNDYEPEYIHVEEVTIADPRKIRGTRSFYLDECKMGCEDDTGFHLIPCYRPEKMKEFQKDAEHHGWSCAGLTLYAFLPIFGNNLNGTPLRTPSNA